MKTFGSSVAAFTALLVMAASCATTPPARSGGETLQVIQVTTHRQGQTAFPGALTATDPTIEAVCTATNDRGSWTIKAPGRFEILGSSTPLRIACTGDGYEDAVVEVRCIDRTSETALGVAHALVAMEPGGVLLLPVVGAATLAVKAATPAGSCSYAQQSKLQVWMSPAR